MGKVYEKDTNVKLSKWYRKLPIKMIEIISDISILINTKLPCFYIRRKKHASSPKRDITFYL